MTKKEASDLLGVSSKTIMRRVAAGKYTCTRADGQFGEVSFTYSDLGLEEPAVPSTSRPAPIAVAPAVPSTPRPAPIAVAPDGPSPTRPEPTDEEKFVAAYKAGYACDSFGNRIGDADPKRLLGFGPPSEPEQFNQNYQIGKKEPMIGTDGKPVVHAGSPNHPLIAQRIADGEDLAPSKDKSRHDLHTQILRDILNGWSR